MDKMFLDNHDNNSFMKLQLFADENGGAGESGEAGENNGAGDQTGQEKTISKELYDKKVSELAKVNKQLKELQDKDKSESQLLADKIQEAKDALEKKSGELKEANIKLNRANAISELAAIKTRIGLDDKVANIDDTLELIVTEDSESTLKNAKQIANLLKAVYEKGANDYSNDKFNTVSKDGEVGGSGEPKNYYAELIKQKQDNATGGRVEL